VPIVRIDMQAGKTTVYKRAVLRGVREGMKAALGVPNDRIMQRIIETPAEDIDAAGDRSDGLTIVDISMIAGRGVELKDALYREVSRRLSKEPGIGKEDLVIIVNDPSGECFYVSGEIQCDVSAHVDEE
jgi:4-oxalocrotonate tautomerase